jgi:hypothetical protein
LFGALAFLRRLNFAAARSPLCRSMRHGRCSAGGCDCANPRRVLFGCKPRMEFFDVGAVIYFLRKLSWIVPGFTVAEYHDKLLDLHRQIQNEGSFVTHSTRILIEACKPG